MLFSTKAKQGAPSRRGQDGSVPRFTTFMKLVGACGLAGPAVGPRKPRTETCSRQWNFWVSDPPQGYGVKVGRLVCL